MSLFSTQYYSTLKINFSYTSECLPLKLLFLLFFFEDMKDFGFIKVILESIIYIVILILMTHKPKLSFSKDNYPEAG